MVVDISAWMDNLIEQLESRFGDRVWFVGLQGSYARGEATEKSDIDAVVVLDELSAGDIQTYNLLLDDLPHRKLTCGFLSGRKELMQWEPAELFHFYYDTKPMKGSLDELLTVIDDKAINRAIKMGACNIFHACVHNMLHEKSEAVLQNLYKSAAFVIRAIVFKQHGRCVRSHTELLKVACKDEKCILDTFLNLQGGMPMDFQSMSEALFLWSQKWCQTT